MSKMSYINIIEKYDDHRDSIHYLLASILGCFANEKMFEQSYDELSSLLTSLCDHYPFISILYLLDEKGKQICPNISGTNFKNIPAIGEGIDRSRRSYYLAGVDSNIPVVTEP
ncbi:MAG: PDC sensor domain-containing protein [Methylococcales bacterium]|nr:PDC sensor domain-containing protein [Methylococcales bacterium]